MSEFVNVTEVEKLPLDKIDSLIAIDADKSIKRTSITVDQVIDEDSTNPISSKGVWDAIEEFRGEVGAVIDDINTEIQDLDDDIIDIRDEIITLNDSLDDYATKEDVDSKIAEIPTPDLTGYATESYVSENYQPKGDYLTSIPSEYITETELNTAIGAIDLTAYATTAYVDGLIGDINSVLDEINGEEV